MYVSTVRFPIHDRDAGASSIRWRSLPSSKISLEHAVLTAGLCHHVQAERVAGRPVSKVNQVRGPPELLPLPIPWQGHAHTIGPYTYTRAVVWRSVSSCGWARAAASPLPPLDSPLCVLGGSVYAPPCPHWCGVLVCQVDARILDEELLDLLRMQLSQATSLFSPGFMDR